MTNAALQVTHVLQRRLRPPGASPSPKEWLCVCVCVCGCVHGLGTRQPHGEWVRSAPLQQCGAPPTPLASGVVVPPL